MSSFSNYIKQECANEGFFDCSINLAQELPIEKESYKKWIEEGYHGNMKYLENNLDMRFDPKLLMTGTKSIITVLLNYYPKEKMPITNNYRIAKYAYGQDYHHIVKDKLNRVAKKCEEKFGKFQYRAFTDSAPIPDRIWAKKGGLGWIGKNTLLINKSHGSFFIIGHLFIDRELKPDNRHQEDLCLDCTKCIDACPTQALFEISGTSTSSVTEPTSSVTEPTSSVTEPTSSVTEPTGLPAGKAGSVSEPTISMSGSTQELFELKDTSTGSVSEKDHKLLKTYSIDARKCLSYQTIENKSAEKDIPPKNFRNWIFGCDICQDVCPFNKDASPHSTLEFDPHSSLFQLNRTNWQSLKPMEFGEIFRGTPVKRAGYKGLVQNIEWLNKRTN